MLSDPDAHLARGERESGVQERAVEFRTSKRYGETLQQENALATGWRIWVVYALSWIPMGVAYAIVLQLEPTCSGWCGVGEAAYAMPMAALLGMGVWWLSGRLPWPLEWRWSFFGFQVLLSVCFASLWVLLTDIRPVLAGGWIQLVRNSGPMIYLGWLLMAGICLYGILAVGSYAILVNRRLR